MLCDEQRSIDGEDILVIDDVETNRLVLEEIIKNMGCHPVLAESGEEALEMLKRGHPQLILTDISMPGINGYELCRTLKRDERTKDIPVVFISAFDNPEDIVEGFGIGGEDYITKPFISEVVQARVGVHLRLHEAKRELMEMNRKLQVSINEQLKQMEMEKKNILSALANIAAKNSEYESDFLTRLGHNCRILAQGMQLSPLYEDKISDSLIDTIELAASLCDLGNIGISKELLLKREQELTEEERSVVHSHTDLGVEFLNDLYVNNDYNDFISTTIDIVRSHHENWDGSGYPNALKADEIPLAAQIVSLVSLYCRLTEENLDNKKEALEEMRAQSGKELNPQIFEIFCKISRQLC